MGCASEAAPNNCHVAVLSGAVNRVRESLALRHAVCQMRVWTLIPIHREHTPITCRINLRRLRLPLPRAPRTCTCRRPLVVLGDHRAACATAGVTSRAMPIERAVAKVCRARLAHVWPGTLCWLTWTWMCSCAECTAHRSCCQTYPELGRALRCCLVVFGIAAGGRPFAGSVCWPPQQKCRPLSGRLPGRLGS